MGNAATTFTSLTGYALVPVVITFLVVHMLAKYGTGAMPLFGVTTLIAIGLPSFLTLWWPGLADSLKKNGQSNIDSSLAGTWVAVSLVVSFITCFVTYARTKISK